MKLKPARSGPPLAPVAIFSLTANTLGRLLPTPIRDAFARFILQAGWEDDERTLFGSMLIDMLLLALCVYGLANLYLPDTYAIALAGGALTLIPLTLYLLLTINAERRAAQIERNLPDVLQLVSANMRAGMTVEEAIGRAASAEMGELGRSLARINIELQTGASLPEALTKMADSVRSESLQKAIRLVVEGHQLGGQMAQLLHDIALTLREVQQLRSQMKSALMAYAIFIFIGATLAAPALFAVTVHYSALTSTITGGTMEGGSTKFSETASSYGKSGSSGGSFATKISNRPAGSVVFTPDDLRLVAYVSLFVISACASLLLGIIYGGHITAGLKYMLFLVPITFVMFYTATQLLGIVIGSMAG